MLLEGYHLHKKVVKQFNNKYKLLPLYGIGYGLPIAIFIAGFSWIWFTENIFLEVLFDERYNQL